MADDEFALRRDMAAAAQVQNMLESEHVKDFFASAKAIYIDAWENSQPRDIEGREACHKYVVNLSKLQRHLEAIVANGRLAERQIAEITARPKRFGIV
jgi:hypothetical protein